MKSSEIRYHRDENWRTASESLGKVQDSGLNLLLQPKPLLTFLYEVLYNTLFFGGEIAAQLAELREVTMEKTGTVRVPDAKRGAVHLGTLGGELRCTSCGKVNPLTPEAIEEYAVEGWPYCCGLQMLWFTRKDIDEEERRRNEAYPPNSRES